uniref:Uncharacterized protein n=1 Tax=Glossina austeni TaxID=7395 RepID=A0A1A9V621_GLOAU
MFLRSSQALYAVKNLGSFDCYYYSSLRISEKMNFSRLTVMYLMPVIEVIMLAFNVCCGSCLSLAFKRIVRQRTLIRNEAKRTKSGKAFIISYVTDRSNMQSIS